jgi:uncharacterized protein (DUF2267 family)
MQDYRSLFSDREAKAMDESRFLHELETRTDLTRDQAFKVTIAVLQELHDRLSPREADDVAAQLPGDFKALWHAFDVPGRDVLRTHKKDFIRHIAEVAEITQGQASKALMATFKVLQMLLKSPTGQEGEAWDVFSQLPKDLKKVWLASATMAAPKAAKTARPTR